MPSLSRQTKARLTLVEKQLCELDREIDTLIKADKTSARRREIVQSIPGLGSVASAAILTYLPEIGTLDPFARLAASLAWCLTTAIQGSGRASPLSAEDVNPCVMPSTCRRWWRCATTRI